VRNACQTLRCTSIVTLPGSPINYFLRLDATQGEKYKGLTIIHKVGTANAVPVKIASAVAKVRAQKMMVKDLTAELRVNQKYLSRKEVKSLLAQYPLTAELIVWAEASWMSAVCGRAGLVLLLQRNEIFQKRKQ
jgi:hypothetical protein